MSAFVLDASIAIACTLPGPCTAVQSGSTTPVTASRRTTRPCATPPTLSNVPPTYTIRPVSEIALVGGPTVPKEIAIMGMSLATSWGGLLVGLYGYILPFVLYATWVAVAMWDLIRQESEPLPHRTRWMLLVLVVPFLGPLLYFAFGRSPIPRQRTALAPDLGEPFLEGAFGVGRRKGRQDLVRRHRPRH